MPTVPLTTGQRVSSAPLPNATLQTRFRPEDFGAAAGQALQQLGAQQAQLAEEERRKANQLWGLDNDVKLASTQAALEARIQETTGRNAFALPGSVLQEFDAAVAELEADATNDEQRLMLRRLAAQRRMTLERTVQLHVARERIRFDDERTEAALTTATNEALANIDQPERIALSLARQQAIVRDHAARTGKPAEWVEQKLRQAQTALHSGVIEQLLARGDDIAASEYLTAHREAIDGSALAKLDRAVEAGSLAGESRRRADEILAEHMDNMGAALTAADKIKDAKVADATKARIRQFFADKRAAEQAEQQQLTDQLTQALNANNGDYDAIAAQAGTLPANVQAGLRAHARAVREGVEPVTDWTRYYDLKSLASSRETQAQFARINLLAYRGQLADTEFKELTGLQASLRAGNKGAADKALNGYRTTKQIVDDALTAIGVDPTPRPSKRPSSDAVKVASFRRQVDEQVQRQQEELGRPLRNDEVQAIVDHLLVKGTVPGTGIGGFFKTERRVYELQPEQDLEFDVAAIPPAEVDKIRAALARHGRDVTDAAIVELYRLKLEGMRRRGQ